MDPNNRLKQNAKLLKNSEKTLVYNLTKNKINGKNHFISKNPFILKDILKDIYERSVTSILVEGGTKTINCFLENKLWNEARVLVSEKKFTRGIKAPKLKLEKNKFIKIKDDKLYIIRNGL